MIKAVIIVIIGIIPTLKCNCLIKKEFPRRESDDVFMLSLIKSQGTIPQMNHGKNGISSSTIPPLSPIVMTNHKTKIIAAGCRKTHGKPR